MASTYTTDLAIQLMATGENAGTWGAITNTNLVVVQQAIAGYESISIAGGAQTTALVMTQNALATARNAVIKLTGTITGNQIVTVPDGIEKTWIVSNGTSGAYTVQFKYAGTGTGQTWSTTDKGIKILYADGTDIQVVDLSTLSGTVATAQIANFAVGTSQLATNAVTAVKITNSTITLNKLAATGTRNSTTFLRGDDTFAAPAGGGIAFETSLRTSSFTAASGTGYLIDSSSATITVTLPASPTTGDQIALIDATGGISSNPINISRNGNKIVGADSDTSIILARQGINIVYAGATQGWNISSNFNPITGNPINTYPIEFFIIGGGGGGGADDGGGGGGGGYRTGYFTAVKGTTYTITVGSGGASTSAKGGDSSITGTSVGIAALGGGVGGGEQGAVGTTGGNGGCGGGGGGYGFGPAGGIPTQTYIPFMNLNNYTSQGYIGGFTGGNHTGGDGGAAGGGGAGAAGTDATSGSGGTSGGDGIATSITGSSATYGGGGGGKGRGGQGSGGSGGGGNAQSAGQANTGGGGGGSGDQQASAPSGGSGRVILKFPTALAGTSTGSPTSGTTGGYTTLSFTGSGSYTA